MAHKPSIHGMRCDTKKHLNDESRPQVLGKLVRSQHPGRQLQRQIRSAIVEIRAFVLIGNRIRDRERTRKSQSFQPAKLVLEDFVIGGFRLRILRVIHLGFEWPIAVPHLPFVWEVLLRCIPSLKFVIPMIIVSDSLCQERQLEKEGKN